MLGKMKLENLEQLYLDELKDAYDFEHQILEALPKMEGAATTKELKDAFRDHRRQTENQVKRLEQVFNLVDRPAERKSCAGMKGVIKEGEEYVKAKGDNTAIDAGLISAAQRVEHYEIAAYGTLRTYANALGHTEEAALLQQTLEEEAQADEKLTRLAESGINVQAAAEAE